MLNVALEVLVEALGAPTKPLEALIVRLVALTVVPEALTTAPEALVEALGAFSVSI